MNLNQIADRILVLSLVRSPRRAAVLANYAERGITNFELIDAVDGLDLDVAGMRQRKEVLPTKHGDISPGEIGCYLSHVVAWRRALADGMHTVCICEDDGAWQPAAGRIMARAFDGVPDDWEVLYLHSYRGREALGTWVAPGVYVPTLAGGTQCILYKRRAVRLLVESLGPCIETPVDWYTNKLQKKHRFKTYIVFPYPNRHSGVTDSEIAIRGRPKNE